MTKRSRLTLTRDGERVFSHMADRFARSLDGILRTEKIKKKDLANRAGVNESVVSRALDGSRNIELRTLGALYGAAGYTVEIYPKKIYSTQNGNSNKGPQTERNHALKIETVVSDNNKNSAENRSSKILAFEVSSS